MVSPFVVFENYTGNYFRGISKGKKKAAPLRKLLLLAMLRLKQDLEAKVRPNRLRLILRVQLELWCEPYFSYFSKLFT
jgi:hypothetical protein